LVYVTDKDQVANELLRLEIAANSLYRKGNIRFQRPDFSQIIEDHSVELICNHSSSSTLLAFCGSPILGDVIHQSKIANDMVVAMTGNKKHQMEFVSESYGGVVASKGHTSNTSTVSNNVNDPYIRLERAPCRLTRRREHEFFAICSESMSELGLHLSVGTMPALSISNVEQGASQPFS
jgi:hypothetical protein